MIGNLWQYVLLESIRKYPESANYSFIIDLIHKALPNYKPETIREIVINYLSIYTIEREWCRLDDKTLCYSLTDEGIMHLSGMTKYEEYEKYYKETLSFTPPLSSPEMKAVFMGAFSVLLLSMEYCEYKPEQFGSLVATLLEYEYRHEVIPEIEDILKNEDFRAYYQGISRLSTLSTITLPKIDSESAKKRKNFDEKFIGALLMLDIFSELSPINSIACIRMLPIYFTHHNLSYNPILLQCARLTSVYAKRRNDLTTIIRKNVSRFS